MIVMEKYVRIAVLTALLIFVHGGSVQALHVRYEFILENQRHGYFDINLPRFPHSSLRGESRIFDCNGFSCFGTYWQVTRFDRHTGTGRFFITDYLDTYTDINFLGPRRGGRIVHVTGFPDSEVSEVRITKGFQTFINGFPAGSDEFKASLPSKVPLPLSLALLAPALGVLALLVRRR